jgi:hypothetical protein
MRIRKQLAVESGAGLLYTGAGPQAVNYTVITWGTFDNGALCIQERNGSLEGDVVWPSGVAELRLEDGETRRILLRRSGTFAISGAAVQQR